VWTISENHTISARAWIAFACAVGVEFDSFHLCHGIQLPFLGLNLHRVILEEAAQRLQIFAARRFTGAASVRTLFLI
jgi:hypothetical protein